MNRQTGKIIVLIATIVALIGPIIYVAWLLKKATGS